MTSSFHYNRSRLWGESWRKMRVKGYKLNELCHLSVIDVNVEKENIFPVILRQSSEARSCHCRQTARTKVRVRGLNVRVRIPAAININIPLMWVIARNYSSGEFSAVVSQPPKTQADIAITLPLSQPCWAPRLLLSMHFHSKYTDHCTRLRKHVLWILAGGVYSGSATDLLYLVFRWLRERREQGQRWWQRR